MKRICWIRSCLIEEWQRSFLQLIASCITWANASWAFVMKWHKNKLLCTEALAEMQWIHPSKAGGGRGAGDYATWVLWANFGNCFKDIKFMLIIKMFKWIHLGSNICLNKHTFRRNEPKRVETASSRHVDFFHWLVKSIFIFKWYGQGGSRRKKCFSRIHMRKFLKGVEMTSTTT